MRKEGFNKKMDIYNFARSFVKSNDVQGALFFLKRKKYLDHFFALYFKVCVRPKFAFDRHTLEIHGNMTKRGFTMHGQALLAGLMPLVPDMQ